MRMDGQEESSNVEDARGTSGGGGGGGFGIGGRGLGIGSIAIAVIAGWIFGINPLTILGLMSGGGGSAPTVQQQGPAPAPPATDTGARFVSQVLRSTEDVWTDIFKESGRTYQPPKLVLFTGSYPTACGQGQAAMGPFYCPEDQKVYIDLRFYKVLEQKLGAPGQFAQAYVVAHEVGHHVQKQLGISDRVASAHGNQRGEEGNSVRLELQADCFAGIWAKASDDKKILDPGDIDEALTAASAIGDDRLQKQAGGRVNPETWTHGSSAQRSRWFKTGYERGDIEACDTFAAAAP